MAALRRRQTVDPGPSGIPPGVCVCVCLLSGTGLGCPQMSGPLQLTTAVTQRHVQQPDVTDNNPAPDLL